MQNKNFKIPKKKIRMGFLSVKKEKEQKEENEKFGDEKIEKEPFLPLEPDNNIQDEISGLGNPFSSEIVEEEKVIELYKWIQSGMEECDESSVSQMKDQKNPSTPLNKVSSMRHKYQCYKFLKSYGQPTIPINVLMYGEAAAAAAGGGMSYTTTTDNVGAASIIKNEEKQNEKSDAENFEKEQILPVESENEVKNEADDETFLNKFSSEKCKNVDSIPSVDPNDRKDDLNENPLLGLELLHSNILFEGNVPPPHWCVPVETDANDDDTTTTDKYQQGELIVSGDDEAAVTMSGGGGGRLNSELQQKANNNKSMMSMQFTNHRICDMVKDKKTGRKKQVKIPNSSEKLSNESNSKKEFFCELNLDERKNFFCDMGIHNNTILDIIYMNKNLLEFDTTILNQRKLIEEHIINCDKKSCENEKSVNLIERCLIINACPIMLIALLKNRVQLPSNILELLVSYEKNHEEGDIKAFRDHFREVLDLIKFNYDNIFS